jgi:hypothetical protein
VGSKGEREEPRGLGVQLSPGQRVQLVQSLLGLLEGKSWGDIDLILTEFGFEVILSDQLSTWDLMTELRHGLQAAPNPLLVSLSEHLAGGGGEGGAHPRISRVCGIRKPLEYSSRILQNTKSSQARSLSSWGPLGYMGSSLTTASSQHSSGKNRSRRPCGRRTS